MRMPGYDELSEEQDEIYLSAPLDEAMLITGPPGSGKTVMAFHRAHSLAERARAEERAERDGLEPSGRNRDIQVVMYNKVLRRFAENACADAEVDVSTWHQWFYRWWKATFGENAPEKQKFKLDWPAVLRRVVSEPDRAELARGWGHLIVDEGQDFPSQFYDLINMMIQFVPQGMANTAVTILADENQRIHREKSSTISEIIASLKLDADSGRSYHLCRNYRNTRPIAELAAHFYTGLRTGTPELPERDGEKPKLFFLSDLDASVRHIESFARNRRNLEIGVIVQSNRMQSTLFSKLEHRLRDTDIRVQRFQSGDSEWGDPAKLLFDEGDVITVVNKHSCKGLEFDAVFIPELQRVDASPTNEDVVKMEFYVMVSRAREHIHLLCCGCEDREPPILRLFPESDSGIVERRNG